MSCTQHEAQPCSTQSTFENGRAASSKLKLKVLEYCLLGGQPALSTYPATQSVQILDALLKPLLEEVAWELSREEAGAADRAEGLAAWLEDTAQQLKDADAPSSKRPTECLKAALKSRRSMLDNPSSSQAVKRAGSKFKSLEQLHSSFISAAAAKQPALAAAGSSSSISASPFAADISSQLARSAARPNQVQAFEQLNSYFTELSQDRPAPAQLVAAMQATHNAMCRLRGGVCKMMLDSTMKVAPGSGWFACQKQLDAWLAAFYAAYEAEQQLLGLEGAWPNIPAGVVEPTGAGKTGIINLAPFAALGPLATPGSACKVLVVTPNLAIRNSVFDSFSQQIGKNCLRDTLKVTSHPELLPTAFDLSALPGMASAAAEAAAAGKASGSTSKVIRGSGRTSNNCAVAAAVAAAAAMPLDLEEADNADDMFAEFEDAEMDEDLMNNAAAVDGCGEEEAAGMQHAFAGISSKTTAAAVPAGLASPLQQLAAAHVVVANIQQLSMRKLEALFPRNYFDLVIMDEAHHTAARTWGAVLEYFAAAAKGSSTVEAYSGSQQLRQLSERYDIQKVALEDAEVREATMRYSMQLAQKLRSASGQRHTIIAQATDQDDAESLCQQWRELSQQEFSGQYKVDYTHSGMGAEHQARVKALAKAGQLDVVIHVGQLGEGFDAPSLSVVVVFRVFRSMAPFMQLLGRAARRIPAIPATHLANVAFLVAHPLLGYHKHWQLYCEERQDCPRELNARGKASNVRLVSFTYPPEATASGSKHAAAGKPEALQQGHAGSSSAGTSVAAAAGSRLGGVRGQTAGLPGPDEVSYMVHPSEIAGNGQVAAPSAPAPAVPVMAAAAAPAVAPAARVAAADTVHVASRQEMQQQLQLLAGPRAAAVKLTELRSIIASQKCLGHITTSGKGRDAQAVRADMKAALQQMLTGGGVLSFQHLKQQQQRLLIPGIGMTDLKQVREALAPWLSHVKLSGAGRCIDVVKKELLQAVCSLIELQVAA